jgi:hypothetical protein
MEFTNKENAIHINIKDLQKRFKKIKNTVINLKKVNQLFFTIIFFINIEQ